MNDVIKTIGCGVLVTVGFIGVVWALTLSDFALYKFWGIKYENTRREIFEQSKAYNQGQVQQLQNMYLDYQRADEVGKQSIRSVVLQRTADLDLAVLPVNLRSWVEGLQHE